MLQNVVIHEYHMPISRATQVNESSQIYLYCLRMIGVAHVNESCHTIESVVYHTNELHHANE